MEKKEISYKGRNPDDWTFKKKRWNKKKEENIALESVSVTYERIWYYTYVHTHIPHEHSWQSLQSLQKYVAVDCLFHVYVSI